ncbi:hypothetical protein H8D83_02170 [Candidatus Woesearchaeota archaeon]|nr:hypothetical protein [Candidatus Woesearchaeota archaeon]MBL7050717.1 hypothetical protein [Candidatus Woesearchaeota archaeon]
MNRKRIDWDRIIVSFVILFVISLILINYRGGDLGETIAGRVVGNVSVCINTPPTIDLSGCGASVEVGSVYSCDTGSDSDGDSLVFSDNTGLFDINESNGEINFTAVSGDVGEYGINISVYDDSGCSNNFSSGILSLSVVGEEEEDVPTPSSGGGRRVIVLPGFLLDQDSLKVLLKVGDTAEKSVKITNTGDTVLDISIIFSGLEGFVDVSETEFGLDVGESKSVVFYFNALSGVAGVYSGEIFFISDSLEISLPVMIEVEERGIVLDLRLNIPEKLRQLKKGEDVSAKVALFNLGGTDAINVFVKYIVKNIDGEELVSEEETIGITEGTSFIKKMNLPEDIGYGDYVFYAEANYKDNKAVSGSLFEVVSIKHVEKPAVVPGELVAEQVFGIVKRVYAQPIISLLMIIIILLVGLMGYQYLVLKNLPQSQHKKLREIHIGLKRSAKSKSEKELYKKKLEKQLKLVETAHRLKYISDKAYKKSKRDVEKVLKEL